MSDDTDVFVLLVYHYHMEQLKVPLTMESPRQERAILYWTSKVQHRDIVENLLPAHAMSGCDTVASYFGIGKSIVIKVLKDGNDLSAVGIKNSSLQDVIHQASGFLGFLWHQE